MQPFRVVSAPWALTDSTISIPLADLEIYGEVEGTELWSGEPVEIKENVMISLKSHGAQAYHFLMLH